MSCCTKMNPLRSGKLFKGERNIVQMIASPSVANRIMSLFLRYTHQVKQIEPYHWFETWEGFKFEKRHWTKQTLCFMVLIWFQRHPEKFAFSLFEDQFGGNGKKRLGSSNGRKLHVLHCSWPWKRLQQISCMPHIWKLTWVYMKKQHQVSWHLMQWLA